MRKQFTLMALAFSAMCMESGKIELANKAKNSSGNSFGNSPYFMPTKSQQVKNKLNRLRYK